jgi:hypothetical protein
MSSSVLPVLVSGLISAEEPERSLPMPPVLYAVIAFVGFLIGLGMLWTFRNTGAKVSQPGQSNDDEFHG